MVIRKATIQDVEQLRPLYTELEKDGVMYQPEHFVIGYRDDDFFKDIFESDTQDILVAECESGIVGLCHIMISQVKNVSCLKNRRTPIFRIWLFQKKSLLVFLFYQKTVPDCAFMKEMDGV